jgi:SAM-dependent methyltransferase
MDFSWARDLSDEEWCAFLAGSSQICGKIAPEMPPEDVQRLFVGCAGIEALTEAHRFLSHIKETLVHVGTPLHDKLQILDFGSGWGRVYRVLMRDVPSTHLTGADPDPGCIGICMTAMPFGRFIGIPPRPPYQFRDHEFDLIYAYSVFTHLAQDTFEIILDEFARILKPGGLLFFTTLRSDHIDFWEAHSDHPAYKAGLDQVGFNAAAWRSRLANGDFLFVPTGGATAVETPDIYGWALLSRSCLERSLAGRPFEIVVMYEPTDLFQAFVAIRKQLRM